MEMVNVLSKCFEENGIIINDWNEELEMDSIQYISLIVCIEQNFEFEYPDELLLNNSSITFNKIYTDILEIMSEKTVKV